MSPEALRAVAREVLRAEAAAVASVEACLDESFDAAVRVALGCTGSVIVCGIGKSGLVGQKISATLASTGTPSHFLHATEAAHGDLGRIRPGDVVLLLSYSGQTEEVVTLAALLRQDRVPTIAMTGNPQSHLAALADAHLSVGKLTEVCPHNLAPTSSTTAMLALGDALALCLMRARDFSAEDFKRRHPGGALGRQMMPLGSVMRFRAGENLPLLLARGSVREALASAEPEAVAGGGGGRGPRRSGAMIFVHDDGTLAGILTDADVRRRLVALGAGALDLPVAEVMTRTPKSLAASALVRDAVQLVREVRLDEIPVVDEGGRPVGLIDVQDLIALKVVDDA
jgi:arabinose-5-phosphate isomerase